MKILITLSLLCTSSSIWSKTLGPLNFKLLSGIQSNVDLRENSQNKNANYQDLSFSTKLKFKPAKKWTLLSLPIVDLSYFPELQERLRTINATHTTVGLYIPTSKNIFTFVNTIGLSKFSFLDDNFNTLNSQNIHANIEAGHIWRYSSGKTQVKLGSKYADYSTPRAAGAIEENDYLEFYTSVKNTSILSKSISFIFETQAERRLYKERSALSSTGDEIGETAEIFNNYEALLGFDFQTKASKSSFRMGRQLNDDRINSGRDFQGWIAEASLKYSVSKSFWQGADFEFEGKFKEKNYRSFQLNPEVSPGQSPALYFSTLGLQSLLRFKSFLNISRLHLLFNYKLNANFTNSPGNEGENHTYGLGFEYSL